MLDDDDDILNVKVIQTPPNFKYTKHKHDIEPSSETIDVIDLLQDDEIPSSQQIYSQEQSLASDDDEQFSSQKIFNSQQQQQDDNTDEDDDDEKNTPTIDPLARARRKSMKEHRKRAKGGFAFDELSITVDTSLAESVGGDLIHRTLTETFQNCSIAATNVAFSIQFCRKLPERFASQFATNLKNHHPKNAQEMEIDFLLVRLSADGLLELLQAQQHQTFVQSIHKLHPQKRIILVIEGLSAYLSKLAQQQYKQMLSKKKQTSPLPYLPSAEQIELDLMDLELQDRCHVTHTKTPKETAHTILNMCKGIAEAPYKKQVSMLEFNSKSLKKKVSKNYKYKSATGGVAGDEKSGGNGTGTGDTSIKQLCDVWYYQLLEIPGVTEKMSKAITQKYSSMYSLLKVYCDESIAERNKELLLTDMKVEGGRKVGATVSTRVFKYYTSTNPQEPAKE